MKWRHSRCSLSLLLHEQLLTHTHTYTHYSLPSLDFNGGTEADTTVLVQPAAGGGGGGGGGGEHEWTATSSLSGGTHLSSQRDKF